MKKALNTTDLLLANRPMAHSVFWLVFVLLFSVLALLNTGVFVPHLVNYLTLLPAQLIAAYSLVYYFVPQFLLRKRYFSFFGYAIVLAYALCILARLMIIYIAEPLVREDFSQESLGEIFADPLYLLGVYIPAIYLMVILFVAVNNIKGRYEDRHQVEVLRREKTKNELQLLKAQIHPHFLFNTLNNLYSLTQERSPKAPAVVLKLSAMLDYMLYHCQGPVIAIHREIDLLQNYIDLESLRYGDRLDLQFEKSVDNAGQGIAPLILLPIVENAFKHGAKDDYKSPKIRINLRLEATKLIFSVFNSKPEQTPSSSLRNDEIAGIGTKNLARQLKLIYPQKHQLQVEEATTSYLVTLKITLA